MFRFPLLEGWSRVELLLGKKVARLVDLLEAVQPDLLVLLQEVPIVGVLQPLDLLRAKLVHWGDALGRFHAPVRFEPRIDLRRLDTHPDNRLPVVLRSQREGLFGLRIGILDVCGDAGAVIESASSAVQSGVSGHLHKSRHCNTSL